MGACASKPHLLHDEQSQHDTSPQIDVDGPASEHPEPPRAVPSVSPRLQEVHSIGGAFASSVGPANESSAGAGGIAGFDLNTLMSEMRESTLMPPSRTSTRAIGSMQTTISHQLKGLLLRQASNSQAAEGNDVAGGSSMTMVIGPGEGYDNNAFAFAAAAEQVILNRLTGRRHLSLMEH